jgi:hypothetical protein
LVNDFQDDEPKTNDEKPSTLSKMNEISSESDALKQKLKANAEIALEKEKEKMARTSGKLEDELSKSKKENDDLRQNIVLLQKRVSNFINLFSRN